MTITRQNYEVFLIDYLDGKLTPSQVGELLVFLQKNPDINAEFEGLKDAVLITDSVEYPNKSSLKKKGFQISGIDSKLDYLAIATIEGDITDKEKEELDFYLENNKEERKVLNIYNQTKINPDKGIVLTSKSHLKRVLVVRLKYSTFRLISGVAASLLIVISGYTLLRLTKPININNTITQPIEIAVNQPTEEKPRLDKPIVKKDQKQTVKKQVRINKQNIANQVEEKVTIRDDSKIDILKPRNVTTVAFIRTQSETLNIHHIYSISSTSNIAQVEEEQPTKKNQSNNRVIGVFEIAQMGFRSFGKLIGKEIKLDAKRDEKGKIKEIKFESDLLAFSAPVNENEE